MLTRCAFPTTTESEPTISPSGNPKPANKTPPRRTRAPLRPPTRGAIGSPVPGTGTPVFRRKTLRPYSRHSSKRKVNVSELRLP